MPGPVGAPRGLAAWNGQRGGPRLHEQVNPTTRLRGAGRPGPLTTSIAPVASAQSNGEWGDIDWRQFEGTTLNVLATAMPVSDVYAPAIAEFEKLTGITVKFTQLNDTDRKNAQLVDFQGGTGEYDVSNVGISNREEFVAGELPRAAADVPRRPDADRRCLVRHQRLRRRHHRRWLLGRGPSRRHPRVPALHG